GRSPRRRRPRTQTAADRGRPSTPSFPADAQPSAGRGARVVERTQLRARDAAWAESDARRAPAPHPQDVARGPITRRPAAGEGPLIAAPFHACVLAGLTLSANHPGAWRESRLEFTRLRAQDAARAGSDA